MLPLLPEGFIIERLIQLRRDSLFMANLASTLNNKVGHNKLSAAVIAVAKIDLKRSMIDLLCSLNLVASIFGFNLSELFDEVAIKGLNIIEKEKKNG